MRKCTQARGSCMNRVLVIGSSGNVGRHVLSQLSAKGAQVRALTRKPDASRLPPQIPLVRGDPALPETLDSCLQNIDTVFLLWTAPCDRCCSRGAGHREACSAHRFPFRPAQNTAPVLPTAQSDPGKSSASSRTQDCGGRSCALACSQQRSALVGSAPAMSCAGPIFRPTAPIDE